MKKKVYLREITLPSSRAEDHCWDLPKPNTNYVYNGLQFPHPTITDDEMNLKAGQVSSLKKPVTMPKAEYKWRLLVAKI
jgi:hypothetical protein